MTANTGMLPPQPTSVGLHSPKSVQAFGILQVIFGAALIVTDIFTFSTNWPGDALAFSVGGSGFYAGIFFIITGSFGTAAGGRLAVGTSQRSRQCLLITSMVLSILSTILASALIIALGIFFSLLRGSAYRNFCAPGNYNEFACNFYDIRIPAVMGPYLAFQGLMWIFCLGQSIAAGVNICKMPKSIPATQVVYVQPGSSHLQGAPGQSIHFVANPQPAAEMGGSPVPIGKSSDAACVEAVKLDEYRTTST
ncbi:uncharacterized protein LOC129597155 [Paramacrobiotus metropolitanus]|uniref:uncharacterized protein LOC129597155 n=1 Tax=Paramacrobiotus metropolitanus TaxID=2943436 RepID=UPI002445BA39|nr:uncharacterized protein LOC129597155 [Paramacrobiotus metropolitanus]